MLKEMQSLEFWVTIIIGGLLLGFAFTFADLRVQLAAVGVYVTLLLGLVVAVLIRAVSVDVTMRENQEISQRIAQNPNVRKFYDETIEPLCRIFEIKDNVFSSLVEERLADFQHELRTNLSAGKVTFPAEAFRVTYADILSQPDIKEYKSVAWVKSEDYWQDPAGKSSLRFNLDLLQKGVDIERIFIVRDDVWDSAKIKNWIRQQRDYKVKIDGEQKENKIRIAVTKESLIPVKENLLEDYGIYGNRAMGVQNIDDKSKTTTFDLYFDKAKIAKARRDFEKLKIHTLTSDELESYLK